MSMNNVASAERAHIGFFGRRNAGKSSVVNAVTGQSLSLVSEVKGTTTDPVMKGMEILPLGPVVIVDTPGIDDDGDLGAQRVGRARRVLNMIDVAVLVVDVTQGLGAEDNALIETFKEKNIPYIVAFNKCDLPHESPAADPRTLCISAVDGTNIHELKEMIARSMQTDAPQRRIVGDIISAGDTVVLVVPIDSAAPKGRLILPQQQTIRDILDSGAIAVVTRDTELTATLARLVSPPKLVITDSQAFERVAAETPADVALTSFSILFARYKGNLLGPALACAALDGLAAGDSILISEGCTHHRQCDDIGTVKLPRWIREYTGKEFDFRFTSGRDFPEDLSPYKLIIHCGACMLTEREMRFRYKCANDQGVPMTNYGIMIAHIKGILRRSLGPFTEILNQLPPLSPTAKKA